MEFLNIVLPTLLYIFGIILLIVLIILGIRTKRIDNQKIDLSLTDDVSEKVSSLDNLFSVIDKTTDGISLISDKIISTVSGFIINLVNRKRKDDENE